MFAPFSQLYIIAPSTLQYGFGGTEGSIFAPHDSGLGTFASEVGLFGHYEPSSMQNEVGPSSSMQQTGPELELISTQDVDKPKYQGEHHRHVSLPLKMLG
ncbi:hypothetical protein GH714_014017 [Hevea brasiliensis]|uniref:Uncharacterized protein n=1 Tax=Hevea brasiliensis TaxID=3981 RepID=A0A6A6L6H0_HEVBR|nr:hypothetical protein GH714_014017 [Hevea brasiliensis]